MIDAFLEAVLGAFVPGFGVGRRRERRWSEMWTQGRFPALRRNDGFATWVEGTASVAPGALTFEAPGARGAYEVAKVDDEGRGPMYFGPTRVLAMTTQTGAIVRMAVRQEWASTVTARLLRPGAGA